MKKPITWLPCFIAQKRKKLQQDLIKLYIWCCGGSQFFVVFQDWWRQHFRYPPPPCQQTSAFQIPLPLLKSADVLYGRPLFILLANNVIKEVYKNSTRIMFSFHEMSYIHMPARSSSWIMTPWLHFGCEQIVFKPDGSQFNLRKMHCSLLPRRCSCFHCAA